MSAFPNEIVIQAGRGARRYWSDLWLYRELLYFLAWRDIVVRYKQTAIGVAWALLQPLLLMIILTLVFGRLAKLPSEGVPYSLLVLCLVRRWMRNLSDPYRDLCTIHLFRHSSVKNSLKILIYYV